MSPSPSHVGSVKKSPFKSHKLSLKHFLGEATARTCIDLEALWITLAVWDVATDVAILAMPVPVRFPSYKTIKALLIILETFRWCGI